MTGRQRQLTRQVNGNYRWLVVAQRLGAGDEVPRRVWLVTGWRRSRAFARELAAAIQDGR